MAILTVYAEGQTPAPVNAGASGDEYENDGYVRLVAQNNTDAAITATAVAQRACSRGVVSHGTLDQWSIPAGGQVTFGPTLRARFFNNSAGRVLVTYSATAGLTVFAVRMAKDSR